MERLTKSKATWIPVLVFLVFATTFTGFWFYGQFHRGATLAIETEITAGQAAIRLKEYIGIRFRLVGQMRELWTLGQINTPDTFTSHALDIQRGFSGLLAINYIDPEGFIRWVVPAGPNQAAKDQDLKKHPGAAKTYLHAMNTGQMAVTPPVGLLQGGQGIAAYFPMIIDGKVQGCLNAVFRLTPMIEDCLAQGVKEKFNFSISDGDETIYVFGDEKTIRSTTPHVLKNVKVGSRNWIFTLAPSEKVISDLSSPVDDLALVLGLFMALGLAVLTRKVSVRDEALRENDKRYRTVFENAQVALFRININGGNILEANRYMAEMFGYDDVESFKSQYRFRPNWIVSEERIRLLSKFQKEGELRGFEAQFYKKEGDTLWARFSANIYEESGFIEGVGIDITEEKFAEKALVDSKNIYRTIFETTGTGTTIFRDDAMITLINSEFCELTGYSREEVEGKMKWMEFIYDPILEKMQSYHENRSVDPSLAPRRYETQIRDKKGGIHYGMLTIDLIPGTDLRVASFLDLTENKKAELQMFRAEKMAALGQIIAGVAHEINNPNNFIYFNLPILKRYIEAMRPMLEAYAENQKELKILNMPYEAFLEDIIKLLENMEHGSHRITGIVSELKNYIRNNEEVERRPQSLPKVIENVMMLVGKQVSKMVKNIHVDVTEDLPLVMMNSGKVEQVIINLLINAGHAADKEESWVHLSARVPDDNLKIIEIIIEDNGCGISETDRDKIFDPFFTTKGRDSGTGLGLAISQRTIEEHGGKITVTSRVGVGTKFIIVLPISGKEESL